MFSLFATSIELSGFTALVFIVALFMALGLVVFIVLSPGVIVAAETRKVAKKYVDERANTVVAQYDAPYGLSPAEIGLLYDMKCGDKEVQATLLSLAYRKLITIDPNGSVTVNDPSTFEQLNEYERIAVQLHDKQQDFVTNSNNVLQITSSASAEATYVAIPKLNTKMQFTTAVQKSLRTKGYTLKSYSGSMVGRVLLLAILLGLWPLALAGVPMDVNGVMQPAWSSGAITGAIGFMVFLGIFLFPVYIFVSYLVLSLWTKIAGRTWLNTKQVRKLWPELEGYRLFLEQTDLAALQADAENGSKIIAETLPYAMVFNLDTKWRAAE